jgi:PTH1 family peptidyl-tRNA hydrolase
MIRLMAALGNPGPEYALNRHNVAWQMIEYFTFFSELNWKEKFNGLLSEFEFGDEKLFLMRPMTFMNRSGSAVASASKFFKIPPEEILVIHDELELEFGIAGLKFGGGLGGHNGLRSITAALGTRDFNRFRIGISRPDHKDITSYVLGNFNPKEREVLPGFLSGGAALLEARLGDDFRVLKTKDRKINLLVH